MKCFSSISVFVLSPSLAENFYSLQQTWAGMILVQPVSAVCCNRGWYSNSEDRAWFVSLAIRISQCCFGAHCVHITRHANVKRSYFVTVNDVKDNEIRLEMLSPTLCIKLKHEHTCTHETSTLEMTQCRFLVLLSNIFSPETW